ncbi:SDR family oxidoreductase [Flavisolibacter nicotianae]|uniref:SDR family oxidoreductase n=1 Tax=Flavisolibacter nicotianae TaxID=2364882 RepID=UPI000EB1F69C|nr:SDR family oxidoreductase [Flavisolibacter nicotianae]
MQKGSDPKEVRPPQEQPMPGIEQNMKPKPVSERPEAKKKLDGKVALITGGDSGIGGATARLFAQEGADVAIVYLSEHPDAEAVRKDVEEQGRKCVLLPGNIRDESFCQKAVEETVRQLGKLDILVNNAATQTEKESIEDISTEQLRETFETNIFSMFWFTKYALKHLKEGAAIINTTSVTAYRGSKSLLDYSATKGAIVTFTRSLSAQLVEKGIRVNAVAPGPIWTPLIVGSFDEEKVKTFGSDVPMGRAGQPAEVATCYLFLASQDSSYFTGQVLHPNGGEIVNG